MGEDVGPELCPPDQAGFMSLVDRINFVELVVMLIPM